MRNIPQYVSVHSLFKIRNSPLELLMIFQVAVSLIDSISQSVSQAGRQAGRQAKQTEHFSDLRAT
jgi:hypothetical protein